MSQPIAAADPHPRFIQEDSPAEIGQAIAAFLRRIP
jgi:hypothetical protein